MCIASGCWRLAKKKRALHTNFFLFLIGIICMKDAMLAANKHLLPSRLFFAMQCKSEMKNICLQSKSCLLPLQQIHFKSNKFYLYQQNFTSGLRCTVQICYHLEFSLQLFAAKSVFSMEATRDGE